MRLRVSLTRMPLVSAFSNSRETVGARTALILELAHSGVVAFSECVTDETTSSTQEDNRTALGVIKRRFAAILREGPLEPQEFLDAVEAVKGSGMAKAAVEMLLWDYSAKVKGVPLDRLLGSSRGYAETGIAIGLAGEEELRERIRDALGRGYARIKVKIDRKGALATLGRVRDEFPRIPLSADANGCFELGRDMATLRGLDAFRLRYLEQPLRPGDIKAHSSLAEMISTPVCLDESVTGLETANEALEAGAAKVINVKPGRVGGLATAMEIAETARAKGAHVWVGGMLETGVGRAFNVALASQKRVDYPGDTSPNDRYFSRDIVENPFKMRGGRLRPNKGPGIGVVLDRGFFSRVTLRRWEVL